MNYLAHLYIADATATSHAGAILGDFVRGRLTGRMDAELETGIALHRRVDSYTDNHPLVRTALTRFEPPFRRYAGILTDVYFDHILARDWQHYHALPLAEFAARAGAAVHAGWPRGNPPFPVARVAGFADLLMSYRSAEGIATALAHIDRRLRRASPLPAAMPVLQAHHDALAADFAAFFPALVAHAREIVDAIGNAGT